MVIKDELKIQHTISHQSFDEERALYGIKNTLVDHCAFAGPADGESALKETSDIALENCKFDLRYPLWHVTNGLIDTCSMSEGCRAALWYDCNLTISHSDLGGIKALRECKDIALDNCSIVSSEFGWRCSNVTVKDSSLISEYPFFECKDCRIDGLKMEAKYSFQYVENTEIRNCHFKTKDAFWHTKNVTVYDSVLEGEYLAWYSENLHLINCRIIGTQPLCYCKGLVLENCTMEDCDLAFERSEVQATVQSHIVSVKNPVSGSISALSIGEVLLERDIVDPALIKITTVNDQESKGSELH